MSARVVVTGGRKFDNWTGFMGFMASLKAERGIAAMAHGGAKGADDMAHLWAKLEQIPCTEFRADWSRGPSAGPARNFRMLTEFRPDVVVAFPGGKGTADCVSKARALDIEVIEVGEVTP